MTIKIEILPDGTIPQVEMTSCGLNGGPLEASGTYEAVIACSLWSADGVFDASAEPMDERYPYFTQTGADGEDDSESYIANMRDGSVAGYKYFCFNGVREICVVVRGGAKGRLMILTEPAREPSGTIDIEAEESEKSECHGKVQIPDGISALYFKYIGIGKLDFFTFEFQK